MQTQAFEQQQREEEEALNPRELHPELVRVSTASGMKATTLL